jgi:polypeptide N-acetylgalactosaminyltransferase
MPKVKLIRQKERKGLMVTRMTGVLESVSQVLTFLDSHIEATDGWLEPLLERIHLNPKVIACPVIEEVNDKTFQYKFVARDLVGVFFWNLDFGWTQIHIPTWAPYTTPVMAGGLFSIR